MLNELKQDADTRMGKSVESLKSDLVKIRTGRAHPSLLEHVMVDYYGAPTPLNQVASISIADSRMLNVSAFDKTMVQAVEKAIMTSDLGLNPSTAGEMIRVPLPALTEERRKDLIKVVRAEGEQAKVAIRNIRRDVISDVKSLVKEKEATEDDERRFNDEIQKITDKYVLLIDETLKEKEKDLMEI